MREIWTNKVGELIYVYQSGMTWYGSGGNFDFVTSDKDNAVNVLISLGYRLSDGIRKRDSD